VIRRLWKWFWSPTNRYGWGGIFILGGLVGVIFWGGFMEQWAYEEYKESVHYANAAGVRVICSDCHVPKDWTAKLIRKIKATNELWHKFTGTIDTAEKFEAKRLEMAENVWAAMEANDSQECRNCHSYEAMAFHKQKRRAEDKMRKAMEKGETCIECHKGLAHKLPEDFEED
jgi:nitrate/TMAO reductase-like tetraheme cytochrome c subunit